MVALTWDNVGEKTFEAGIDKGVLYKQDTFGAYSAGFPWHGLVSVAENPSGAESNKQYANNKVYASITSAEEFSATLEAFTFPDEFAECDGTKEVKPGVYLGQQRRVPFGLAYRSKVGNDLEELDHGYKLHLVYGGKAKPSARTYTTINESPEAMTMSWEISTDPVEVEGHRPTSTIVIDSTKVDPIELAELENLLFGSASTTASLPTPEEVFAIFSDPIV